MQVKLTNFKAEYAKDIVKLIKNENVYKYLRAFANEQYSLNDALDFIEFSNSNQSEAFNQAIIVDGGFVGSIGLVFGRDIFDRNAEIGYWIGEPYWHKGITSNAVMQMCDMGFGIFKLNRISATIACENIHSINVLKKCGFSLEGVMRQAIFKYDRYYDAHLYSLLREDL